MRVLVLRPIRWLNRLGLGGFAGVFVGDPGSRIGWDSLLDLVLAAVWFSPGAVFRRLPGTLDRVARQPDGTVDQFEGLSYTENAGLSGLRATVGAGTLTGMDYLLRFP
jgi:hypothetical protein